MKKRTFFERLTGSINLRDEEETQEPENKEINEESDFEDEENEEETNEIETRAAAFRNSKKLSNHNDEDGQLIIDCYKTPHSFVIQAVVAGVKQDDLDVAISRDMVTIRGKRSRSNSMSSGDYLYQELYWGSFSRSVALPEEVDVDNSEAVLKSGVLTITLPKIDKNKVQKVHIKND